MFTGTALRSRQSVYWVSGSSGISWRAKNGLNRHGPSLPLCLGWWPCEAGERSVCGCFSMQLTRVPSRPAQLYKAARYFVSGLMSECFNVSKVAIAGTWRMSMGQTRSLLLIGVGSLLILWHS